LDLAPELPRFFRGDALRLQQVLTNLLGNAVKFTERGEVRLVIDGEGDTLRIAVHDTGIGIEPDRLDRIFKPFSQADASMSRRFGGTGLGTTIARQIVELMGGTLEVRSTPGVGSAFTALLSLPEGRPVQVHQEVLIYDLPPLLVLVADDVPQNLELLTLALGSHNHQVVTACNGVEAIEAMLAQRFDVVLMDVQMPEMNGLEATRRMRALERERGLRHTPIVALTASVMEQDRIATQEAGMDGFAAKPVDMPALLAEIARVTGISIAGGAATPQTAALEQPAGPLVRELVSIDWATGVRRWGNEQVLLAAVERFVEQHAGDAHELQVAVRAQDLERARALAHRLRGAAANLSLAALHACAEALEDALRSGSVSVAQSLVDSLGHALHDLSSVLQAFTATDAMESGGIHEPSSAFDPSQWHAWAASALLSLARGELDDDNLQSLLQAMRASGQAASAQEIERALDNFDFDHSGQLLQQLIASTPREFR
jgi:CheY-like chemotaxis protein/anti-sigma regulatory factor (Ser/Thr protein kinase)